MKAHYKLFLSLAIGSFVTFAGCQDDEVVDLVKYPVNQPAITINDAEGASKATLTAVYKSDGTLELNGPVTRTYTFHFAASPEDATVTFDVINTNIPKENVEISDTKVVLPAGSTDASVTVTLKDEDFSFAASNYDAATYELGVKASVEGYKIGTESIESKIVIEKEAYIASCSVVGENGNTVSFERAFSQGAIVNTDPISYAFKMKLDKPARKDVKVKLATTGLDEKFMNKITVTPAEITIPAGELESAEITWSITDDFLLTTTEAEFHTLVVAASVESEDPVVKVNSKENILTFNVDKVVRYFKYLSAIGSNWVELSKDGWGAEIPSGVSGSASYLIDGNGGSYGSDVYSSNPFWFVIDMKSPQTFLALGMDYYYTYAAKKVRISTSLDNETWTSQGVLEAPRAGNHYFEFFSSITARYVKVELLAGFSSYIDVTEVYIYNAQ
ncbi:DUF4989 domain-containing protein [Bacteroides faecis]|uniref:DUF4989 domain-containing protein n=1 Tax=Bacteroides faecis TaxID=674529 RepID=UPI0032EAA6A9